MTIKYEDFTAVAALIALEACNYDDADIAEEAVQAENDLFSALEADDVKVFGEDAPFAMWCLKATAQERLDMAFRLFGYRNSPRDQMPADVAALIPA